MQDDFTEHSSNDNEPEHRADDAARRRTLRDAALLQGPERQALLREHPLHGLIIEIKTPPVKEALLLIQEHIKFRRPGLALAADCRHGKTTMLTMVSKAMAQMFPNVPHARITLAKHDTATEKALWTDVLLGFKVQAAGTAVERKNTARNSVLTACREAKGDTFALYIDEAQNWGELEFNYLRDFSNELREYEKKALITITVGDLKLKTVADAIRLSDKGLWSRFLRTVMTFAGISSKEELLAVMKEYDSIAGCEYPIGSGVSYSEFFLPHAYAGGWRLASEMPLLWRELEAVAKNHDKPLADVGMQWIADSILAFLTLEMLKDAPGYRPNGDTWQQAVASSQFETTFL